MSPLLPPALAASHAFPRRPAGSPVARLPRRVPGARLLGASRRTPSAGAPTPPPPAPRALAPAGPAPARPRALPGAPRRGPSRGRGGCHAGPCSRSCLAAADPGRAPKRGDREPSGLGSAGPCPGAPCPPRSSPAPGLGASGSRAAAATTSLLFLPHALSLTDGLCSPENDEWRTEVVFATQDCPMLLVLGTAQRARTSRKTSWPAFRTAASSSSVPSP